MLDTIGSALREHKAVQADIDLLSALVREWEDLFSSIGPGPSAPEIKQALADKQLNLLHAISNLKEGFIRHHVSEEKVMGPVLGSLLELALADEHQLIMDGLDRAEKAFLNADLHEPVPGRFTLKHELDSLCRMMSEHTEVEEKILLTAKSYLEKHHV